MRAFLSRRSTRVMLATFALLVVAGAVGVGIVLHQSSDTDRLVALNRLVLRAQGPAGAVDRIAPPATERGYEAGAARALAEWQRQRPHVPRRYRHYWDLLGSSLREQQGFHQLAAQVATQSHVVAGTRAVACLGSRDGVRLATRAKHVEQFQAAQFRAIGIDAGVPSVPAQHADCTAPTRPSTA